MKTKGKSSILFILCILFVLGFAFVGYKGIEIAGYEFRPFSKTITKGLDLQGGVSVVMEIQDADSVENLSEKLEQVKEQLAVRVNKVGVAETVVSTEGDRRVRIDIPGQYDSAKIIEDLSKSGELTFVSPDGDVILTGDDVKKATVTYSSTTNEPQVSLELNDSGKTKFAEATEKYIGQAISIKMDDETISSPTVQAIISDGNAVITGSGSITESKSLAAIINAGALPVTIKQVSLQTVGAQLGETALPNALKAGAIGIALIFLFLIIYYRVPGLLASFALTLFVCLVLFIFEEIGATLTLPGIAGFLLTIGMAVDANVLIFERIREEVKKGVSSKTSVQRGFENAMSSIVDSNVTTIIAALVLYFLGSGSVKGFAITLMIGIVVSLFTALFVTKFLMNRAVEMGLLKSPSCFGVKRG
ncbi:MAG: protein translocase subunit SecD [Clostridium sp.]